MNLWFTIYIVCDAILLDGWRMDDGWRESFKKKHKKTQKIDNYTEMWQFWSEPVGEK